MPGPHRARIPDPPQGRRPRRGPPPPARRSGSPAWVPPCLPPRARTRRTRPGRSRAPRRRAAVRARPRRPSPPVRPRRPRPPGPSAGQPHFPHEPRQATVNRPSFYTSRELCAAWLACRISREISTRRTNGSFRWSRHRPDFLPQSGGRDQRPARTAGLRGRLRSRGAAAGRARRGRHRPRRRPGTARSSAGPTCPPAETNCTTSAGTRAAAHSPTPATTPTGCSAATSVPALPGIRSSSIHVYDTHPDPRQPTLVRTISSDELAEKAGYSRPHTLHCGPDGIFVSCLGGGKGAEHGRHRPARPRHLRRAARLGDRPRTAVPGLRRLVAPEPEHADHQRVGHPSMIEDGIDPELLLGRKYGHRLHFWDLAAGKRLQTVDLGEQYQMVLELAGRTTPGRPGASSAWWSAPTTCPPRSGGGAARTQLACRQGDHHPGRTCRPGHAAARAQAVRGGAAAGQRHRPVRG